MVTIPLEPVVMSEDGRIVWTDEMHRLLSEFFQSRESTLSDGETLTLFGANSGIATARAEASGAQATATSAGNAAETAQENIDNSVAAEFALSVSQMYLFEFPAFPGAVESASVTVSASGGVAPYTYAWTKKSGTETGATQTASAPSSATTTFTATLATNQSSGATWICTVTDSTGGTPLTAAINVTNSFSHIDISF